jgi:hypothetical protein
MPQLPLKMTTKRAEQLYRIDLTDSPASGAERRAEVRQARRAEAADRIARRQAEAEALARRKYRSSIAPKPSMIATPAKPSTPSPARARRRPPPTAAKPHPPAPLPVDTRH